ncbi:MAG TPA: galactose-1-phosphate uridylyltransferase, partial [Armatimonadota bacterium]|nr:galactose-1-phosphate uridylyltransferase [Armatimonadota bacterium]
VATFLNKFPSLRPEPPVPAIEDSNLYGVDRARGICEVLVYTPVHDTTLAVQPVEKLEELVYVWRDRYQEIGALEYVDYVYMFENKGEAIGVTLNHPHGQIYAFPFIPPRLERELESLSLHREETGRCLLCDVLEKERAEPRRLVLEGEHFYAGIPFYARWPYEVHIWAAEHRSSLAELSAAEMRDLARVLKGVMSKYDALWGFSMPYIMALKQRPTDGRGPETDHFRIEFYPPLRTAKKLKYLAGVETGAGTFINDTLAEEKAAELRAAEPVTLPGTAL